MYINLCLWHFIKVSHTKSKTGSTSKFIGLSILPFQLPTGWLIFSDTARSTFPGQNTQNTPAPDHFWQLRCQNTARRCGAKHILKSKCKTHTRFGPLLEAQMSKKCTPLWREAHFQVKMYKTPHVCATFGGSDVEKVHAVVARSTFPSQNVQNTTCSRHFWRFGC